MMSMRYLTLACCVVAAAMAAALPDDKYTDKYDNIDIKEILENKRLLQAYVDCVLDKGKCTNEGKELKDHLKEALETGCEKCTEAQKNGTHTVIQHLIKNEPDMWKELVAKFDPSGKYRKKYEDLAKEKGIEIPE